MAQSNSHYENWKQTATYSKQFQKTQYDQSNMQGAAEKFFGCTDQDMAQYREEQERNRPVDPKTLIKQQFVMSKSEARPVMKAATDINNDFTTSNSFYHKLTNES
mmetsp:Transcript_22159/g.25957  ORF Transcript_22159/g.25957 Transcript_22159/m.25957 type:complete len:105 (+) Transcript_22159:40-354(+)